MKPSALGLPAKFTDFRTYPGFDQLDCAVRLATNPERFQIANLPTGAGKSLTYASAAVLQKARWLVLVGTKGLQTQLLNDGLAERLMWGHRNYPCAARLSMFGGTDDADADDPEFRCSLPRDHCPYMADVKAARAARSVVANNAYWLSIGRYSDSDLLGKFDYLVIDEAHQSPPWLAKSVSIFMTSSRLHRMLGLNSLLPLPTHPEISDWHGWSLEMLDKAKVRGRYLGRDDAAEKRKLDRLAQDLEMLARVSDPDSFADAGYTEPWIVIPFSGAKGSGVQFSPRWGSDFAERYLFRDIPRVLLTSATVTREHATYLGIPESQSRYTEVPSPFDVRRRPVIWAPTTRVDFRMTDGARWKLRQRVDEIIEAAIDQQAGNGIIHTGSYERNRELVAGSKYAAAIITHRQDSEDFARALAKFKEAGRRGQFAIMASPRMQEGVDLPDQLCRWGIIMKLPFPDSRDPLTKARAHDPRYRLLVVAETIKQMCGRPVRGMGDFATTFVLDDHWAHARLNCPFEEWFRAAFDVVRLDKGEKIKFLTERSIGSLPDQRAGLLVGT